MLGNGDVSDPVTRAPCQSRIGGFAVEVGFFLLHLGAVNTFEGARVDHRPWTALHLADDEGHHAAALTDVKIRRAMAEAVAVNGLVIIDSGGQAGAGMGGVHAAVFDAKRAAAGARSDAAYRFGQGEYIANVAAMAGAAYLF